ncbi:hypothetical protein LXL04_001166 [Taraxacum kok-saghyz]
MTQLKPILSHVDNIPSTTGKFKPDKSSLYYIHYHMAYFFFTKDILNRKKNSIFEGPNHGTIARDFTYIDDIVNGCLSAIDTAKKSTGTGGKKKGEAQFRIINLGNTSPVSVYKLVNILEKLLKVKARKKMWVYEYRHRFGCFGEFRLWFNNVDSSCNNGEANLVLLDSHLGQFRCSFSGNGGFIPIGSEYVDGS